MTGGSPTLPLAGLTVIDFTHVLAGPACAYYLGLLGAKVVKVESPRGDAMRHRGGTDPDRAAAGMSTGYLTQGAGKRSVVLDLDTAAGRAGMDALLADADVLVENHLPATLDRLGLGWDRLHTLNPRLIHCAMTGYGRGPMQDVPAYDVNIQAASGLMSLTGTGETGPLRTGAPVIDYATALAAGFAICAALVERARTDEGTFVDVSMLETAHALMASTITDHLVTGHVPEPRGNAANSRSPGAGSFPCRDGLLSLGVNEQGQFEALARVIGHADWLADLAFADRAARKANGARLEAELSEALLARSADAWEADMQAAGVPAARVRTLPESLALPAVGERGFLQAAPGDAARAPTLPFRIGATTAYRPDRAAPGLGQDGQGNV